MYCKTCCWLSDGFGDDVRGSGYCYSNDEYMNYDDTCPFWQKSLRDKPLLSPEEQLLAKVAELDQEIEG